ncbi:MAG: S9 family peptidase [Bacteroidetes bacterium]|nr:MAG: S9 family peptidase [Bacteroidota bacterium]
MNIITHRSALSAQYLLSIVLSLLMLIACGGLYAQPTRVMEIEDLFRIKRVSDPQLSPDGKWVAYVVTEVDKAANKSNSDIWLIPFAGGEAKQLTSSPKHDRHPRWSPDGSRIAFESNRNGSFQIYVITLNGGEARQLTSISTEATQAIWSNDGNTIAFVSSVFPGSSQLPYAQSDAENKKMLDEMENSKVKARVFQKLLYRHWDSWVDDKRNHLFVVPADGGYPQNVTPGDRDASPPSFTFSAGDDFDFSPDNKELAYTATPIPVETESWNTNHDIYVVDLSTKAQKQITTNLAADGFPRYSPDGKYIAFRAQSRPGFEADRWQLMLYERTSGNIRSLTESFDSNVESFVWTSDSKTIYFEAEEKANKPIWSVTVAGNDVKKIVDDATNSDVNISQDGKSLVFSHQTMSRPTEIYTAKSDGKAIKQLTKVNDRLFSEIMFAKPENVWFKGAGGTDVQMWIVKPPTMISSVKYPLVYWVHGGPQGAWNNSWSYRWCAQLWAAQGYVLALPNPRGSTGFGQKFTDEISKDWGGKVFEDLMNGLAYMEQQPYINSDKMGAAGASYGGYMMNWFNGHTDKFKTLVCHDGVFNFYSMYGTTEETWFDEWEHGIPWETPDFDKFSPHKYAQNFKTPTLVIHSELDYRVPLTEGQQLFTTLQRKGIKSKMLYFPDEGHWVLKPLNSELWHKTVFKWLSEFLMPGVNR